jgi:hypothetical protein
MVSCPLFSWMTSSAAAADSYHVYSSPSLTAADQVQGTGYSESEVEIDVTDLKLETDAAALELETDAAALKLETDTVVLDLKTETDVSQEILKQERYYIDKEWSTLKLLVMGQRQ